MSAIHQLQRRAVAGPLGKEAGEFAATTTLPLQSTFASDVTSTLGLICFPLPGNTATLNAGFSQLQALALTRIG